MIADLIKAFCEGKGFPAPCTEFKFHRSRKWAFDLAWPEIKVALEIEGAIWVQGRHTRGKGFEDDARKYNAAALMGWRLLRASTGQVKSGEVFGWIEELFKVRDERTA